VYILGKNINQNAKHIKKRNDILKTYHPNIAFISPKNPIEPKNIVSKFPLLQRK